jgi:hypothetical protein
MATEGRTGARYIGDEVYDRLNSHPGFSPPEARRMIGADWRTGSTLFRDYAQPLIDGMAAASTIPGWGDITVVRAYVERRLMEGVIDPARDPWMWAYVQLTGACLDSGTVRKALDQIREGRDG